MAHARLLVASTLLLASCTPNRPPSVFPRADDALARMHASFACVNGVSGEAKIDHRSRDDGRARGDLGLVAVNPDRVSFNVESFGNTLYTLTSDGQTFALRDTKRAQLLQGPAKACNLAKFTHVPVPGHALVSLLRGEAPVLVHQPSDASLVWDQKEGFYRLFIQSTRDAKEEIDLSVRPEDIAKPWAEQRVRVHDVRVSQRGIDLYHVELDDFTGAKTSPARVDKDGVADPIPPSGGPCDAEVPRSIRMRVPHTEEDVIIRYKEAKWNPPIVDGAFSQEVTTALRRIYSDCKD